MSHRAYIVGAGMTPFGIHENWNATELAQRATHAALEDCGLTPADIGGIYFGNTTRAHLEGQLMINGQIAMQGIDFNGAPIVNIENACATGSSALSLAIDGVRTGDFDFALAVGAEKMNVGDREKSMSIFGGGYDVSDPDGLQKALAALGGPHQEAGVGHRSEFMDIYSAIARGHMATFGTTQRQIAAVSAKNHAHAVDNENAYFRKAMSVDDVLAGRPLSYPLTVPMCAPLTDGAAAVVVCNADGLERLGKHRAVEVLASVVGSGVPHDATDYEQHITRRTALKAYERAGVAPRDISVAEVHDASAFAEVLVSEMLGLVEWGCGGKSAEEGVTTIGGRIPINPSGGLESKGHPLAATGLAQVYELVSQLRGEAGSRQVVGARLGIAENGGGFLGGEEAVAVVSILKALNR